MFGMQHTFKKLFGGIAIAAFVAVVAVPSAFSITVITDTLGGNGSAQATPDAFERAVAIHSASASQMLPFAYGGASTAQATDTQSNQPRGRAYNPNGYVYGGASPQLAHAIQDKSYGEIPTASVTGPTGSGFNWGNAGIGTGLVAGLVALLLLTGQRPRPKRNVRTA